MNKKTILLLTTILVSTMILGLVSCSPKAQSAPPSNPEATTGSSSLDGQTLLNERCTVCHTLDRVKDSRKSQEEWEKTVSRMVGKGAVLTPEEQKILIEYLTQTYGK